MATIRVKCPTCNAELEIDDRHLGEEVECGSCLQTFVAEDPKAKKKPYKMRRSADEDDDDEDRPRRRRSRRDDDDEDDYDYSPPRRASGGGGGNGLGTAALILGVLSFPLTCCCHLNVPTALAAIACGAIGMSKPQGRGLASTGLVLGVINLLLYGGLILFFGFNMINMNQLRGR